jgi:Cu(I)/Ag(I) efflux system membrane fusion protein
MNAPHAPDDLREGEEAPPPGTRAMAVVRWVLVAVMAVIATGSVLAHFGRADRDATTAAPAAGHTRAPLYHCPMHPQIVQDHPGECPICNMTLVEKPAPGTTPASTRAAGAPAGLAPITIPHDRVQKIGIRTAQITRGPRSDDLRTVGTVAANERGLAQISPRFSGWIEELMVAETGQHVRRGQVLATIYSPDVLQAQQELLTAQGWTTGPSSSALPQPEHAPPLQGLVADARRRLELLGVSPQEIDAISRRHEPVRAVPIRAPVDGHVITKRAVVGMNVMPGAPLFEIADLSSVWVLAEVYESDLQRVRVGQPARFESAAYPGEIFRGKVQFIYPTVDPGSRTLRLRLELPNRPGPAGLKLRPGMYGDVSLDLPASTALMLPVEALVDTGQAQYVFVVRPDGVFEPRAVTLGARQGAQVEVRSGLAAGETVVTTANFLVDSESRLRAAIDGR